MSYKILDNWNHLLDLFSPDHKDVYFKENYLKLYESGSEKAYCFYYNDDDFHFLLPYLLREFQYENQTYFDLETVYGYGGPIFNYYDDILITKAWKSFLEYGSQNNYIAGFLRFHPLFDNHKCFSSIGNLLKDRQTVALNLQISEQEIWMQEIHTKNRNTIKKGEKNGLQFVADYEYTHLDDFISLYNNTMIKLEANEFYYFNDNYFKEFKNQINDSFLGLIKLNYEVIAAAIFFFSDFYGHYHLSGSNENHLKLSPNNFLLWEAAKELKKRGVRYFHLGGGTNSDENNSLLQFKSRFSKNKYDFYIGKIIFNKPIYQSLCDKWVELNREKGSIYINYHLKYKY